MIGLCDRWHKTPDEILAMDARALRLLDVYQRGHREEGGEDGGQLRRAAAEGD